VRERVLSLLGELGIEKHADLRPSDANESVWKRALIARALILEPRLLLLDEPAHGLTPAEQGRIHRALEARRARGGGVTVIQADHDGHFGPLAPERTIVLHGGKVVAEGEPEAMAALADELERKLHEREEAEALSVSGSNGEDGGDEGPEGGEER
jgi:ABC-type branched-subunit amino acid transport system ATPase component